jgi:hypothetical protein
MTMRAFHNLSSRIFFRLLLATVALSITGCAHQQSPALATHDRTFWRAVIADKYLVPAGPSVMPLAMELAGFVGSTDPELRDGFGYEILAKWIHRSDKLNARDLDALRSAFLPFVSMGAGESGTDTIFPRSFALLNLKELAAADLRTPFLTDATFDELFEVAITARDRARRGLAANTCAKFETESVPANADDRGDCRTHPHGSQRIRVERGCTHRSRAGRGSQSRRCRRCSIRVVVCRAARRKSAPLAQRFFATGVRARACAGQHPRAFRGTSCWTECACASCASARSAACHDLGRKLPMICHCLDRKSG